MKNEIDYKTLEECDMEEWNELSKDKQAFLVDLFKKNILFHNGEMSARLFGKYIKKSCQLGVDIDLIPGEIMLKIQKETKLEYIENNLAIETY